MKSTAQTHRECLTLTMPVKPHTCLLSMSAARRRANHRADTQKARSKGNRPLSLPVSRVHQAVNLARIVGSAYAAPGRHAGWNAADPARKPANPLIRKDNPFSIMKVMRSWQWQDGAVAHAFRRRLRRGRPRGCRPTPRGLGCWHRCPTYFQPCGNFYPDRLHILRGVDFGCLETRQNSSLRLHLWLWGVI